MYRSLLPKKTAKRKATAPRRATRLREKRMRTRMYGAIIASVVAGIVLIGVAWGTHQQVFAVRSVSVQGAQVLSADALQAAADAVVHDGSVQILSRNAIMLYPKKRIETSLQEVFPRIDTIDVSVSSWESRAVTIEVTERTTFAAWCASENECYRVDKDGFIFEAYEEDVPDDVLRIEAPILPAAPVLRAIVAPAHFTAFTLLVDELRRFGFVPKSAVFQEDDVTIHVAAGYSIVASLSLPAVQTVEYVQVLLSQEPLKSAPEAVEYIDVRFGERVYYKLRDTVVE